MSAITESYKILTSIISQWVRRSLSEEQDYYFYDHKKMYRKVSQWASHVITVINTVSQPQKILFFWQVGRRRIISQVKNICSRSKMKVIIFVCMKSGWGKDPELYNITITHNVLKSCTKHHHPQCAVTYWAFGLNLNSSSQPWAMNLRENFIVMMYYTLLCGCMKIEKL